MILVTAHILAKPDTHAEMLRLSVEHVLRSRKEPGCISHAVSQDVENPLQLVFVERWESMDALKVHFGVPESRTFGKALYTLAAAPAVMTLYDATEVSASA